MSLPPASQGVSVTAAQAPEYRTPTTLFAQTKISTTLSPGLLVTLTAHLVRSILTHMPAAQNLTAVFGGMAAAGATFIGVEIAAGVLSVVVRLVEHYTHLFTLGDDRDAWLGAVFLYWAILPAGFLALVVFARQVKSHWNE